MLPLYDFPGTSYCELSVIIDVEMMTMMMSYAVNAAVDHPSSPHVLRRIRNAAQSINLGQCKLFF